MWQLTARIGVFLIVLVWIPVSAIRFQPVQPDPHLSAFLALDHCEKACMLMLQSGVTSWSEALVTLDEHPWVNGLASEFNTFASWYWSDQTPPVILQHISGALWIQDGRVDQVHVESSGRYGDYLLLLGQPDTVRYMTTRTGAGRQHVLLLAYYNDHLRLSVEQPCPLKRADLLYQPVSVTQRAGGWDGTGFSQSEALRVLCAD